MWEVAVEAATGGIEERGARGVGWLHRADRW